MIAEILCMTVVSLGLPNAEYACEHMNTVVGAAEDNNVKPEVLVSLIYHESRWVPTAVSKDTACGLTQVLPKYTRNPKLTCEDLKDPTTSIFTGAKKLNYWVYKYGKGRYKTGLCGYNSGFRCKGETPKKKGVLYSQKVLKYARKIKRKYSKIFDTLAIN